MTKTIIKKTQCITANFPSFKKTVYKKFTLIINPKIISD